MITPLNSQLARDLLTSNNSGHVNAAHRILTGAGYTFVGYHGTNERGVASIMTQGFDPSFAGSSAGLARGNGLYVARYLTLAEDFADTATQADDPHPITGVIPRKAGLGQTAALLRVYARNFLSLQNGVDYVWGGMGTTLSTSVSNTLGQHEIVFRTRAYQQLIGFPTTRTIETALLGPDPHCNQPYSAQESPW